VSDVIKYWPVALFLLNLLTAWVAWSLRQLAKNEIAVAVSKLQARDEALDSTVDGHGTRITRVEGRVDEIEKDILNLPSKADLARVEGRVDAVGREVSSVGAGVSRIENFFLAKGVERSS